MKIIKVLLIALLLALGGCAKYAAVRGVAVDAAQKVEDRVIVDSLWGLCKAASVGAWDRYFGADQAKIGAWRVLCQPVGKGAPRPGAPPGT